MTALTKRLTLLTVAIAALVVALAPSVGARASKPSVVAVEGAGTITWRQVAVLAKPSAGARRVAVLTQFRSDFRPQYVLALDAVRTKAGKPTWYRISVPGRPNGRTGWVRASALDLHRVEKRIVIYRGARKFEFWDG